MARTRKPLTYFQHMLLRLLLICHYRHGISYWYTELYKGKLMPKSTLLHKKPQWIIHNVKIKTAYSSAFSPISTSFQLTTTYHGLTFSVGALKCTKSTMCACAYRMICRIITSFKLGSNIFALISTLNYTKT